MQQQFALAFQNQAPGLFLELAELLPCDKQRAALLAAAAQAGWTQQQRPLTDTAAAGALGASQAATRDAADGGGEPRYVGVTEPEQAGDGWRPLDRSRLAAVAAALPSGLVRPQEWTQLSENLSNVVVCATV